MDFKNGDTRKLQISEMTEIQNGQGKLYPPQPILSGDKKAVAEHSQLTTLNSLRGGESLVAGRASLEHCG